MKDGGLVELALVLNIDLASNTKIANVRDSKFECERPTLRVSLELVDKAHDLILLQRRVLLGELDSLHRERFWRVFIPLWGRRDSSLKLYCQMNFKIANCDQNGEHLKTDRLQVNPIDIAIHNRDGCVIRQAPKLPAGLHILITEASIPDLGFDRDV